MATTKRTVTPKAASTSVMQQTVTTVKALRVLNRLEFEQSGLAGSEFARDYVKPDARPVSLGRMLAMGLRGTAAGYGIAKATGKGQAAGAGIGAALGGSASVAYDKLAGGGGTPEVVGAVADEVTGSSVVLVSDAKTIADAGVTATTAVAARGFPKKAMPILVTKYTNLSALSGPPGWVAAIIQHGMLTQTAQMKYHIENADQREPFAATPHQGYNTSKWGANWCAVAGDGILCSHEGMAKGKTVWRNNFAEWPSPAWPTYGLGRVPLITKEGDLSYVDPLSGAVTPNKLFGQILRIAQVRGQTWDHKHNTFWSDAILKTLMPRVPLVSVAKIDSHWKNSAGKVATEFYTRYNAMMRNAQWLVWAGEMFRIHSANPARLPPRPKWWVQHCAEWGIECASTWQLENRHNMAWTKHAGWCLDIHREEAANPLPIVTIPSVVEDYLTLIVKHTPGPFTASASEQMTVMPYGAPLLLMDMPDAMKSMMPPIDQVGKAFFTSVLQIQLDQGMPTSLKVFMFVVEAVVTIVATVYGGALGVAVAGVFAAILSICMASRTMADGSGGNVKIDAYDIVGIVGSLLGAVAENADLGKVFGGVGSGAAELFDQLKGVAAELKQQGAFEIILDVYNTVADELKWTYMDQVLGTCTDLGGSIGLDREGLNAAVDRI